MKQILRVFPERTALTPTDDLVVVGAPGLIEPPPFDEIHVSCTFTWQLDQAQEIAEAWARKYPSVHTMKGGPACGDPGREFVPGRYVRFGISISSRGCPNNCPWCFVPKREGKLRLLPICTGNDVADNNVTAWPKAHFDMLIAMLQSQSGIRFSGGLEACRWTPWHLDGFRRLKPSQIREIWFAADTDWALKKVAMVADQIRPMFRNYSQAGRRKLRCYVMIGRRESLAQAEARLERVWDMGFLPFAQLYQAGGQKTEYNDDWRALERKWARPAAMFACHK